MAIGLRDSTYGGTDRKASDPIRLLLVSLVVPGEESAGGIVLRRHLSDPAIEYHVAEPSPPGSPLLARLRRTRLHRALNDLAEMRPLKPSAADLRAVEEFRPSAILTVGHGAEFRRAIGLARKTGLPLISIFHDLWPCTISLSRLGRRASWRAFRTLARESALALCVSDNMLAELGRPDGGRVLLPVPGAASMTRGEATRESKLRIGYSGNLFDYGPMIGNLAENLIDDPEISLTVRGRDPRWSGELLHRLSKFGIYEPPLDREAYESWTASLDVQLCALSFDADKAARMRTSFPSKLLESLRFGKPILLWAPEGTAGVQWARTTGGALVVTSPDPRDVMDALRALAHDDALYARYSGAARRCAVEYSNERLHVEFMTLLRETLDTGPSLAHASVDLAEDSPVVRVSSSGHLAPLQPTGSSREF